MPFRDFEATVLPSLQSPISTMAASSLPKILCWMRDECTNCKVFNWKQPDPATLRQCGKCNVVQYCDEHCQKENWKMVHKKQCKVVVFIKDNGSDDLPAVKAPENTMEILKSLMQKTSLKLFSSNMLADPRLHESLMQLWKDMYKDAELTWCAQRSFPKEFATILCVDYSDLYDDTRQIRVRDLRSADQDIWSTLHLLWGRLIDCRVVAELNNLKDPQKALPKELWTGLQEEIGVFPGRVAELIQAFSGDEVPSFKELLKIICGGTLVQKCSFCDASLTVTAVAAEVAGCYKSSAKVALLPHTAPIFCCGRGNCDAEMAGKIVVHEKWRLDVHATFDQLWSSRCDYCFQLSEKVHRFLKRILPTML